MIDIWAVIEPADFTPEHLDTRAEIEAADRLHNERNAS